MINTEWLMVCWFSNGNRDVPDHIEIRRKCKFKNSYFSGVLEHQIVDYLQKKQIFWKRDFSLHFEPCCESKKIEIPYDVMDAKCTLIGYVVISDKPANPTLKVNDEKDLQLKFLNELSNDFALLLEPKYTSFADIYLKCGSIVIPAHKNILSVRSPFFSDMFSNKMKEIQKNEVIITDIDVPVFRIMVTYIYSGKIENLTVPLAGDLLFAADKYKLKGLKTACREYLKRNMSMENALEKIKVFGSVPSGLLGSWSYSSYSFIYFYDGHVCLDWN
ncbi:TD and POZ domain-containing protein 3 [Trichonephila clavata]|uniref:TD and POZ domain-containing protein 3 n=1 Tax=Trichonephila clavata TaxID=2740835 RepID=A0A8X6L6T5_TRICU|nr:TD and POZ domain-containing protein 3 [Trichonephila clavata]